MDFHQYKTDNYNAVTVLDDQIIFSGSRNNNRKNASLTRPAFNVNLPAVNLHDMLYDGQS